MDDCYFIEFFSNNKQTVVEGNHCDYSNGNFTLKLRRER